MPFVCFMGPPTARRVFSLLYGKLCGSVEHCMGFECSWNVKKIHFCAGWTSMDVLLYALFWPFSLCRGCILGVQCRLRACVQFFTPPNTKEFNPHKLGTQDFNRTVLRMSLFSNTVMITIHPVRKYSSFSGCETISRSLFFFLLFLFCKNDVLNWWIFLDIKVSVVNSPQKGIDLDDSTARNWNLSFKFIHQGEIFSAKSCLLFPMSSYLKIEEYNTPPSALRPSASLRSQCIINILPQFPWSYRTKMVLSWFSEVTRMSNKMLLLYSSEFILNISLRRSVSARGCVWIQRRRMWQIIWK